jgi:small-conductance mechanosensitive channel
VLLVTLVLARFSKGWVVRLLVRGRVNLNTATLLGNLTQIGVVALGVVLMLPSFGVDWTGLLTIVGAAGLAISLSLQDVLKNVVAGIYILIEQPFRIGDRITVKEATGTVQGIELRTTILMTDDQLQVVVPNNVIMTEVLTNRSAFDLQRQTIIVNTKSSNLEETSQEITDVLRGFEYIATSPPPIIALEEVKDQGTRLRVQFWVPAAERITLTTHVAQALQARFPEAGVAVM